MTASQCRYSVKLLGMDLYIYTRSMLLGLISKRGNGKVLTPSTTTPTPVTTTLWTGAHTIHNNTNANHNHTLGRCSHHPQQHQHRSQPLTEQVFTPSTTTQIPVTTTHWAGVHTIHTNTSHNHSLGRCSHHPHQHRSQPLTGQVFTPPTPTPTPITTTHWAGRCRCWRG